jgi:pimeloyl-ACP methyl ester carboxylesterase
MPETDRILPAIIAEAENVSGKGGCLDGIGEEIGDARYGGIGAVFRRLRDRGHTAIWERLLKGATMTAWADEYWWSKDALRLHYRDYPGRKDRPPVLCLPGLTRNARDFADLAERLSGEWRVICPDLRGRGESAYAKDPMTYVPLTYLQDIEALIAGLGLTRIVLIGTSLGGLLTMLLGGTGNAEIAGALLNDIGPEIESAGLDRIRTYVGKQSNWPTWLHAARALGENNRDVYPDYTLQQWIDMAKRLCRLTQAGRIVYDYDMKIAEPFRLPGGEAGVHLWPAFDSLKDIPLAVVRGERSDILSDKVAKAMVKRHRGLDYVTVPRTGHAPTLSEPEAIGAIDRLLAKVAG